MQKRKAGGSGKRRARKQEAGQRRQRKAVPARRASSAWTLSVPEAGRKYYGLGRNASYEAVKTGQLPTIRVNKLLRVPVHMVERMLGGPAAAE